MVSRVRPRRTGFRQTGKVLEIRPATTADLPGLAAVDSSFTTSTVFEVTGTPTGFTLAERPLPAPVRKVFPADAPHTSPEDIFVATDGPALCGYLSLCHHSWNQRLEITAIELDPGYRGQGLGRALVEHGAAHGRALGARTYWLEVSNLNTPAIHAYRRWGFTLCGLDTTLYTGTPSAAETALFLSRPL